MAWRDVSGLNHSTGISTLAVFDATPKLIEA
jgi:hypothetical protein